MYNLKSRWSDLEANFKDVSALGLFVNNHDNERFLHMNGDWRRFKSALAFTLTATGIPLVYYGDEQAYGGGRDPANRETLWGNFNRDHEIYKFLTLVINSRKSN